VDGNLRPAERLIAVFTTGDSSGQGLCDRVVPILRDLKLEFDWIIGQSYDGTSNVSGKYSGLQARLRELSKKALYIWCQAHRLNLLVEGLLNSSPQVTGTISLLQELILWIQTEHCTSSSHRRRSSGARGLGGSAPPQIFPHMCECVLKASY